MMRRILVSLAVAAASFSGLPASAASAPRAAPARADWVHAVADTGVGWRMGNPKAATRLVEYGSFNCPHCAAFSKAAMPAIRKLVAGGKLSYEFRPKQLFPHDPSSTLLALCAGKDKVFAFTEDYMANAPAVLDRLRAAYRADHDMVEKASAGGDAGLARFMAKTGEMLPIAARTGVTAERADRCLGDPALIARVQSNEKAALDQGVTSTPTFFINGKVATIDDVAALGIPVTL